MHALGGAERLAGRPARTWKGKGTFHGSAGAMPFEIHGARQGRGQMVLSIESTDPASHYNRKLVLNEDRCWVKLNGRLEELHGEALAEECERGYTNWISGLLPLREEGFDLSLLPAIEVDGKEAVGVLVRHGERREVRLYFDRESALLVKREAVIRDIQHGGKGVIEEVVFGGYRELDGVRHATRIKVFWDGKLRYEVELTEQARKEKMDDSAFARP
jgi:hypothetical protein